MEDSGSEIISLHTIKKRGCIIEPSIHRFLDGPYNTIYDYKIEELPSGDGVLLSWWPKKVKSEAMNDRGFEVTKAKIEAAAIAIRDCIAFSRDEDENYINFPIDQDRNEIVYNSPLDLAKAALEAAAEVRNGYE